MVFSVLSQDSRSFLATLTSLLKSLRCILVFLQSCVKFEAVFGFTVDLSLPPLSTEEITDLFKSLNEM